MPGIKYIRTLLRANPFTLVLKHAQQTTAGVAAVQPTSANIHVHAHIHTWPDDSQFMCARMWFIGERRGVVACVHVLIPQRLQFTHAVFACCSCEGVVGDVFGMQAERYLFERHFVHTI